MIEEEIADPAYGDEDDSDHEPTVIREQDSPDGEFSEIIVGRLQGMPRHSRQGRVAAPRRPTSEPVTFECLRDQGWDMVPTGHTFAGEYPAPAQVACPQCGSKYVRIRVSD